MSDSIRIPKLRKLSVHVDEVDELKDQERDTVGELMIEWAVHAGLAGLDADSETSTVLPGDLVHGLVFAALTNQPATAMFRADLALVIQAIHVTDIDFVYWWLPRSALGISDRNLRRRFTRWKARVGPKTWQNALAKNPPVSA